MTGQEREVVDVKMAGLGIQGSAGSQQDPPRLRTVSSMLWSSQRSLINLYPGEGSRTCHSRRIYAGG